MREPEVALVFTAEPWVEELHRHFTDHGGARVRQVVVDPQVALDECYDALIASDRWPALTQAFVADVRARGRVVLGVHDREEPAGRSHLVAVGVDMVLASDAGPKAFVEALGLLQARREELAPLLPVATPTPRAGHVVVVGGPAGAGRTEVAAHLARALGAVAVDADDVAPSVAQRVGLPVEPNIRTAIDAAEHGRGSVEACVTVDVNSGLAIVAGLPNPRAWTQTRPGEVVRVVERVARARGVAVVDTASSLEDLPGTSRTRFGVGRALILEADVLVGVAPGTPLGVSRFLSWTADVRALSPETTIIAAINRAPSDRFRRRQLYDELVDASPFRGIVFLGEDDRLAAAAWSGNLVERGVFARGIAQLVEVLEAELAFGRAS